MAGILNTLFGGLFGGGGNNNNIDWLNISKGLSAMDPTTRSSLLSDPTGLQSFAQGFGGSAAGGGNSLMGGIFGGEDVMGGLNTLGQLYGAYKQLGYMNDMLDMQKEQFGFQKDAWQKNYANQVASYNTQLADRQKARLSAAQGTNHGYDSLDTYMSQNQLA